MAYPVYVLLPDGVEWSEVPGTTAQNPGSVRWYLRQSMLDATTQTAVLVEGSGSQLERSLKAVLARATELGGVAVDASTQALLEPSNAAATAVSLDA